MTDQNLPDAPDTGGSDVVAQYQRVRQFLEERVGLLKLMSQHVHAELDAAREELYKVLNTGDTSRPELNGQPIATISKTRGSHTVVVHDDEAFRGYLDQVGISEDTAYEVRLRPAFLKRFLVTMVDGELTIVGPDGTIDPAGTVVETSPPILRIQATADAQTAADLFARHGAAVFGVAPAVTR